MLQRIFHDPEDQLSVRNAVLDKGSIGIDVNSGALRVGDGVTAYNSQATLLPSIMAAFDDRISALSGVPVLTRTALTSGVYVDMYTVPAGYKLFVRDPQAVSPTTGNNPSVAVKRSGSYIQLYRTFHSVANNLQGSSGHVWVLEAGDSYAMMGAAANQIGYMTGILVPDDVSITTPIAVPNIAGRTLYTVPQGKVALRLGPGLTFSNNTAGSRTHSAYLLPPGISAAATEYYLCTGATPITSLAVANALTPAIIPAGWSLFVTSDTNDVDQWAYITVVERPV